MRYIRPTGLLLLAMLVSAPAFAQSAGAINPSPGLDLSGNWAPAVHEDQPERGPGPELADFLGLPITEGARQFALSWDASRQRLWTSSPQIGLFSCTAPSVKRTKKRAVS